MKSFTFGPELDWRKLGVSLYSNSLSYREVLNQNPKWNVTELPPVGAVLVTGVSNAQVAGTNQQPSAVNKPYKNSESFIYPFDSEESYFKSLVRYNAGALRSVEKINGKAFDSFSANTGLE